MPVWFISPPMNSPYLTLQMTVPLVVSGVPSCPLVPCLCPHCSFCHKSSLPSAPQTPRFSSFSKVYLNWLFLQVFFSMTFELDVIFSSSGTICFHFTWSISFFQGSRCCSNPINLPVSKFPLFFCWTGWWEFSSITERALAPKSLD